MTDSFFENNVTTNGGNMMELREEWAHKILKEVKTVTDEQLIIVNYDGIIIASTNPQRIGNVHEGAKQVYKTDQKLTITPQMAKALSGVKPGINLPITFHHHVIGVIGITGRPKDVEPFAELICRMTELMIREAYYLEQKEWETRNIETFFQEWIFTKHMDQALMDRGRSLGVSFTDPYQCTIMQFENHHLSRDALRMVEKAMFDWFKDRFRYEKDFLIQWGNGRFMLVRNQSGSLPEAELTYKLTQWHTYMQESHNIALAMGVGKTSVQKTISQSYQEAHTALKVAEKSRTIIFYHALLLELIIENVPFPTRTAYIKRVFGILKDDVLLETVRTYLEVNLSLKKTAQHLHIHINTLHYRLKQIKTLTNIDPKTSEGITVFSLAFSLMDKERDI